IRGVVETVTRLADVHRVRVSIDLQSPPAPVDASRTILRQLLLNLLSDAIVHHPGAAIRVSTRRDGRTAVIDLEIRDATRQVGDAIAASVDAVGSCVERATRGDGVLEV